MNIRSFLLIASLLLQGCAPLGPSFFSPTPESPPAWTKARAAQLSNRISSQPLESVWWQYFNDPLLSHLQERALTGNLDLQLANARLQQSRALLQSTYGNSLPKVDANGFAQRQRNSNSGRIDPSGRQGKEAYNHARSTLDAAWELDFWGRLSRATEAAEALQEASAEQRHGTLILIQAELAHHYIQLRREQANEQVIRRILAVTQRTRALTEIRFANGVATQLEIAQTKAQQASMEARLPICLKQQTQHLNALSFLLGDPPEKLRAELQTPQPIPVPPQLAPVGVPAELARRRPDIRETEARLHAATAQIGSAQADFYPRISLDGSFGFESSQLIPAEWKNRLFVIGPSLYLPIFEGGRLKGRLALREAQQQEAAIQYQRTVLNAWHEIDNALTAYSTQQQQQGFLLEAVQENQNAVDKAHQQYLAGAVDFLNVLNSQQALLDAEEQQIDSRAALSDTLVSLYKALGGGWEAARAQ